MPRALPLTIQTRFGRRILALFVLSALVPILVLAALGYAQVRDQLTSQTETLLRQAAKSVGMGVLDQLRGASRAHPGGRPQLVVTPGDSARVFMIVPTAHGPERTELSRAYLFEGALERSVVGDAETTVCVRQRGGLLIGCLGGAPSGARSLSAAWDIFLGYDYDATPWRVEVSQPETSALAPLLAFRRVFLATVVLVLGVIVIVAVQQVRRSMIPLQQLREGTERLARRDFAHPVTVQTKDEFADLATSFNVMAGDLDRQFRENTELIERLGELSYGALAALARTIDASSPWTAGHSERVTAFSLRMASRLCISQEMCESLKRGGLLHDIGKIGIPPQILDKPGPLDPDELARIREHPAMGARILAPLESFADAIPIVRSHHERFDGRGYPQGLAGEDIPILARLLAVADVYDALVSSRPYRPGWKHDQALDTIRTASGSQFDPRMVAAFFEVMQYEGDAARFSLSMERLS